MGRGVIVITGASAGIGHATAKLLANEGHDVINLDRAECEDIRTLKVDLADHAGLTATLCGIRERHDIAGLVNNAGLARTAPLEETGDDLLRETFDINLSASVICARELVPAMKRRGSGRIVNVASRSAQGRELRTAYAGSKGGLISITRVWALELGRFGITSNCIAPGPIATELFDRMNPNGSSRRKKMVEEIPVGRIGRPEDVAHAVLFFLAPENDYVTGQTLYVCGGLSAGVAPL